MKTDIEDSTLTWLRASARMVKAMESRGLSTGKVIALSGVDGSKLGAIMTGRIDDAEDITLADMVAIAAAIEVEMVDLLRPSSDGRALVRQTAL